MALRFDLSGNPLPAPNDRMRGQVIRREAPENKTATDLTAATLKALADRVTALEGALNEANDVICTLIDDIHALQARDNVTRDSVTGVTQSVTRDVTQRDDEKRQKAAERQRRRREKMKAEG